MKKLLFGLLLFLLFAGRAHATITQVQDGSCSGSSVAGCSPAAITVSSGDLVFARIGLNDITSSMNVTDSQSNSYPSRDGPITADNNFGRSQTFTGVSSSSGSLTVNCNDPAATATDLQCTVWVFHSSIGSGWVFDNHCSGAGVDNSGGATRTCTSAMNVASGSVVLVSALYLDRAGGAFTAGSGYTLGLNGTAAAVMEQKISATGGGTDNGPIVDASADHWILELVSVKEQAASGPANNVTIGGKATVGGKSVAN
jgi:hypothetical protein